MRALALPVTLGAGLREARSPVPTYDEFTLPLLLALENGAEHNVRDLRDTLAADYRLTGSDRQELKPSGKPPVFDLRVGWAKTDLQKAGLIATVRLERPVVRGQVGRIREPRQCCRCCQSRLVPSERRAGGRPSKVGQGREPEGTSVRYDEGERQRQAGKGASQHAGATSRSLSVSIAGRSFEVPFAFWVSENRQRFYRNMPLTEFVSTWPAWLLQQVIDPEEGSSAELGPALYMTLFHLRLWDRDLGVTELTDEALGHASAALRAASELEVDRRLGMVRFQVSAPDRLLSGGRLEVELNPAVMEILRPPLPAIDDPAWGVRLQQALTAAANSGWAVPGALEEYEELEAMARQSTGPRRPA
jgi:hypothetical protein